MEKKKQTNKQANMTKYNTFSNKLNECRNHWVACVLHFQMTAAIAVDRLQVPSSSFFLLPFSRQSFVITFKLSSVLVLSSVRGLSSPKKEDNLNNRKKETTSYVSKYEHQGRFFETKKKHWTARYVWGLVCHPHYANGILTRSCYWISFCVHGNLQVNLFLS